MVTRRQMCFGLALAATLCVPTHWARAQQDVVAAADKDEASDSEGRLIHDVRMNLVEGKFDEIDRVADGFRREKARWPGGGWKVRTLYEALDAPHHSEPDTVAHLDHLRQWMTLRPESITARVALATSLVRWAWVARGNGMANTVTAEGRQLFHQRIEEAYAVLEGSRDMKVMCPQWFSVEMTVGLAQGWNEARMRELFERAVQFEPEWQYFYKERANYLLPKWYGQPDAATAFAKEQADRLGGDLGNYIYFEVATVILKRGNGNLSRFIPGVDWERVEMGYQAVKSKYGENSRQRNEMAFMAVTFQDSVKAREMFASIGQEWSRGVWRDQNYFEHARDWSNGHTSWP